MNHAEPHGNPVLHDLPARQLDFWQLHAEMIKAHHAECTPETCQMIDYCRRMLRETGHDPDATPATCPGCIVACNKSEKPHPSATGGVLISEPPSTRFRKKQGK